VEAGRVLTGAGGLGSGTTHGSELDVEGSDAEFLGSDGDILKSKVNLNSGIEIFSLKSLKTTQSNSILLQGLNIFLEKSPEKPT
jgi:hypothetical protein